MKKNLITISTLLYITSSNGTFSEESFKTKLQQQDPKKFAQFITEVKTQTNTYFNSPASTSSFLQDFLASMCKLTTGEKINPEDAKQVQRFFEKEEYSRHALIYFQSPENYTQLMIDLFTKFKKNERTLENLKAQLHRYTDDYLAQHNIIKSGTILTNNIFNKKNDQGSYVIPDDIYQTIITQGLIATFIYRNNLDKE